jgi:uncharacterized protein (TIGR03067 family)
MHLKAGFSGMKKTWCAVLALYFVVSGCSPRADEEPSTQAGSNKQQASHLDVNPIQDVEERLQGTWIAVRGEAQGEETLLEGYAFSFNDGQFTAVAPHRTDTGRYEIDVTKNPMHITMGSGLGIFMFRGDELYICIDSEIRPTRFTTSESSYEILTICKRRE